MTNINQQTIEEIAQRTPTSEAFFTYAACRERNVRAGVSSLPAIKAQMSLEGFHPVPQDLLVMFKELDRAGIGQLRGEKFKWNQPIKKVGEMGSVTKPSKPEKVQRAHHTITTLVERRITMCLGAGKDVEVTIRGNLSDDDCSFIAERLLKECR